MFFLGVPHSAVDMLPATVEVAKLSDALRANGDKPV